MNIGGRVIGPAETPYVIAEIGVNHDGDVLRALELTEAAADAGADAVKLQYFRTDLLLSGAAKLAAYQAAAGERDPVEMLRRLELSLPEMERVVERAHLRGIHAIVTVFSVELVDEAERLGWDAFKTASPDVVHRPLLERLEATGRPLIVSTGAATMEEVTRAVGAEGWLGGARERLGVLQCVSSYPTAPGDTALGGVVALTAALEGDGGAWAPVGYSDHTIELDTGALAARLGALMLEKHLTHDHEAYGPDHRASLEPADMRLYIEKARRAPRPPWEAGMDGGVWTASASDYERAARRSPERVGPFVKRVLSCEEEVRRLSRQSIVATRAIGAGETIRREDLTFKRPGTGLTPDRTDEVAGRPAARAIEADTPIEEGDMSWTA